MASEAHDPWALLREAREDVDAMGNGDLCRAIDRALAIHDAALAEHDAVPPSEEKVEWTLPPSFAVAKARLGAIDIRVFEEEAFAEGAPGFNVTLTLLKIFDTLDEAKSAALAAARGVR